MTNAKSRLRAFAAVFMSMILALSMMLIPNEVSALGLSKTSFTLTKGYATTLKVTGSNSTAKWASSDTSVATVSSTGKVIGKGPGTATITATVDGTTLKATVKIVGGKLSVSSSNVQIAENSTEYITVRAKGSHALKANSDDKTVVTTGWVKPWNNNDIRLKLTARGKGTTTVKIYMTQFPDVYTTVKVTVGNGGSSGKLVVNTDKVSVKAGDTASLYISSSSGQLNYALSDKNVASIAEGKWSNGTCTLSIRGLKAGTTTLAIADKTDASVKKSVTITVTDSAAGYYVVTESIPQKSLSSDQIYRFVDSTKRTYKYVLIPASYDVARLNSAVAKDQNAYDYYQIYSTIPSKKAANDGVKEFSVSVGANGTISAASTVTSANNGIITGTASGAFIDPNYVYYNGGTVLNTQSASATTEKRYVLVPTGYDEPKVNTLIANYTKSYDYWLVYNSSPTKKLSTDVIDTWTATVNYQQVTRYILLPQLYDQAKLKSIKDKDMGDTLGGYYGVTTYEPTKKTSTDQIIRFTYGSSTTNVINNTTVYDGGVPTFDYNTGNVVNNGNLYNDNYYNTGNGQTLYILVPANYDQARVNDAMAKYNGYEYNKVYTTIPTKKVSSDVVEQWTKVVDSRSVTRYALYPAGYSSSYYSNLKNEDLQTSSSSYYVVSNTQPVQIASNDISKSWWNSKTNQMRYMIVPYNYDVTRYNDAVAADTGEYLYYHTYTKSPAFRSANDSVQSAAIGGKTVYMLIPANYDQTKINQGFAGQEVTA